ncbi:MAG: cobalamin B12-binding domain-containing protein [Deltaproteobacteria bacterium]|nr:cobalamin B12-binding domain-containing protein [Deltaproteobacteria bacterium]
MPNTCVSTEFEQKLLDCLHGWERVSPTREAYLNAARELTMWRSDHNHPGLWALPPLMVTATIDDGLGHGLEVIEKLAEAAGVRIHSLGLLQSPESISEACRKLNPRFLGLTVLQLDSDDWVAEIVRGLPPSTLLIAGGPAFQYDEDFARRTGTHVVVKNGVAFLQFLMNWDARPGKMNL